MKHTPETFELSEEELREAVLDFLDKRGIPLVSGDVRIQFPFDYRGGERKIWNGMGSTENWPDASYSVTAKVSKKE